MHYSLVTFLELRYVGCIIFNSTQINVSRNFFSVSFTWLVLSTQKMITFIDIGFDPLPS